MYWQAPSEWFDGGLEIELDPAFRPIIAAADPVRIRPVMTGPSWSSATSGLRHDDGPPSELPGLTPQPMVCDPSKGPPA